MKDASDGDKMILWSEKWRSLPSALEGRVSAGDDSLNVGGLCV